MAVDIIITLTTVGVDTSATYNLFSNVDGFSIPYETTVPVASLQSGYTTSAPDGTNTVRVCNTGVKCLNCIDITPLYTTTTTTTLPPVECGETANSGGPGITEFSIPLETAGGVLVIDFSADAIPDKLEIIHNGIKVATTGMTTPNEGPFDNVYGDPTVPTTPQTIPIDQFIGTDKGAIPTRNATFLSETGLSITSTKQQLVWFIYDASDVINDSNALVRVTGPDLTGWNFIRKCDEDITTTTTTTFTSGLPKFDLSSATSVTPSCLLIADAIAYHLAADPLIVSNGDILYQTNDTSTPFVGNGDYYLVEDVNNNQYSARISASGVISEVTFCAAGTTTTTTTV